MTEKKRDDGKVPSKKPSFSSLEDDPLATAGTGGSEDPKGLVRPGGGEVPSDTDDQETSDPQTLGTGAPPQQSSDREEGTRDDGEALPPSAIDPRPDGHSQPHEDKNY